MNTKTLHTKTEKQLVPQLRFAEFKDGWQVIKFDKYCRFQQGVQVDVDLQKTEPFEDYIRFLRIENYTQASDDFRFIPNVYQKSKIIDETDIVVVRYGATAGYIGRGFNGVLANNLFKIIPDSNFFDKNYLFQYLNSYRAFHFFQTEMSGGAMPALSFGIVKALKVPLTAVPEQQKIASFLSSIDTKLQQLTQKKELLEQYKKGLMQQLFSQQLRFKREDGSYYPDWEKKNILDVASMKARIGWQNLRKEEHLDEGEYHLVTGTDFELNKIAWNNTKFVEYERYIQDKHIILKEGDILITKDGSIGKLAFVENIKNRDVTLNNGIFRIRVKRDLPSFVFYTFLSRSFKKFMHQLSGGSSIKHLYQKDFETYSIELPCFEEQQKIANYLSALDTKIAQVAEALEATQQFKKGLLQQMFV